MQYQRITKCVVAIGAAAMLAGCPPPERTHEFQETPEVREDGELFENYEAPEPPYDEPAEPDTPRAGPGTMPPGAPPRTPQ